MSKLLAFQIIRGARGHPMELLYGKAMAKTEQEEAMLDLFRGLSGEQREAFLKATTALAQPSRLIDDEEEAG